MRSGRLTTGTYSGYAVGCRRGRLADACDSGGRPRTVAWLIEDYVAHLEHHLRQLLPDLTPDAGHDA